MTPGIVAMARCEPSECPYPEFPFAPGQTYPESPSGDIGGPNAVYAAVRRCLWILGLDRDRYGAIEWNPLGEFIRPGQQVLLKPNWGRHYHGAGGDLFSVITHPSVIRAILDYVLIALKGRGNVIIGDAPIQSADMEALMVATEMPRLLAQMSAGGVELGVCDFRENVCVRDEQGRIVSHESLPGDPNGYYRVEVGQASALHEIGRHAERFRVTNYDPRAMRAHHTADHHEYLIAGTVLRSDVVINIPKLKTHRKAGLTCCLKNTVGINGSKDYLPHHRTGATKDGGDEYLHRSFWKRLGARLLDAIEARPGHVTNRAAYAGLRVCRCLARNFAGDPYAEGSWYGNDTIWRMVVDLNRVLRFANSDGVLVETAQRRIFNIVDAVIVGGGEGPLRPDAVHAGMVLAGPESATVDAFAARLIGLAPQKIPLLREALACLTTQSGKPPVYQLLADAPDGEPIPLSTAQPVVRVSPPRGWTEHVELQQ